VSLCPHCFLNFERSPTVGRSTMSLRTVEAAYGREVELSFAEIVLSTPSSHSGSSVPTTLPFSIPLTLDTPQSLQTPYSSLNHVLSATLRPSAPDRSPISKAIFVQTRRFTSHTYVPALHPEVYTLDDPTRVEVQIPRTTFVAGETIPLYVTVPPPPRELVLERKLRLRNVRVELLRLVHIKGQEDEDFEVGGYKIGGGREASYGPYPSTSVGPSAGTTSAVTEKQSAFASSSEDPVSFNTTIAHSGASCRLHTTRAVRLRFILHQPSPSASPADFHVDLPSADYPQLHDDVYITPITQTTLLHSVTFRLMVHVSFIDMTTHTERISTIAIPVMIIAQPAPLPEVDESLQIAYQKKHDRPPASTVRYDDSSAPRYEEGEAGPSLHGGVAPPPFEERDAPPPFFTAQASTSVRLPTFLESEAEIIVPEGEDAQSMLQLPNPDTVTGEGELFGFPASEQFDGHMEEDMRLSATPPPTLEMATMDTNVTDLVQQERSLEALSLTLESPDEGAEDDEHPPPPPPAMDDPSDPPPSIDSEFRSPSALPQPLPAHTAASPHMTPSSVSPHSPPLAVNRVSDGQAPPPYLHEDGEGDQENTNRPPPYVDFMPARSN
jgi:hypothetical protein